MIVSSEVDFTNWKFGVEEGTYEEELIPSRLITTNICMHNIQELN